MIKTSDESTSVESAPPKKKISKISTPRIEKDNPSLKTRLNQLAKTENLITESTCEIIKRPEKNGKLKSFFICKECGKHFNAKHYFVNHWRTIHLNMPQLTRVCEICGASFTTDVGIQDHYKLAHSDEKPEICSQCKLFKLLHN